MALLLYLTLFAFDWLQESGVISDVIGNRGSMTSQAALPRRFTLSLKLNEIFQLVI